MAVDPATQFQQASIQAPYQYTPEVTRLPSPIQLPETGQLWAEVGKTAMNAVGQVGEMLQKSPLNPAVKAQILAQQKAAQEGIQQYKWADSLENNQGRLLYTTDAQGNAVLISPAQTGKFAPLFQPKIPPPKGKEAPKPPPTAPGTGKEPQEETKKETTPPSSQPTDENDIRIDTTSTDSGGSDLAASTDNDFLLRRMMQERHAAGLGGSSAAPQGTPSNLTFLNPATGNIEPRMFTAPTAAPPPAAPARPAQPPVQQSTQQPDQGPQMTLGATAQPPPGMELAGTEQAFAQPDQATMANWQAQRAHPVMASGDALNWAKNFDTGAQRATYLQHGGPNGEPAFAFHMKGGGINTVPISQIVKYGGGPSVAGQNTSAMLSTSDALTNQAPQMTLGATAQPPPGMQLGQQPSQPPAAPTAPMPSGTGAGAPQGSPGPMVPPAAVPGAYNPSAYQMPQGPTITETGEVNPALMAGGSNEQMLAGARAAATPPPTVPPPRTEITPLADDEKAIATPEAIAAVRANAKPDPNQPTNDGDPYMYELGPWHIYRDDRNRTNELYAIRQGLTSLYKQQRYILGSDGWQEYELPNTNTRLNVEAEFGGGKGSVVGGPIPDGKKINGSNTFPSFSHDAIVKMSVPQMQQLLELAGKYHNTSGTENSTMVARLSDLVDISQRVQRMIDGNTVALQEGKPPTEYNRTAQQQSFDARKRNELMLPGQTLGQVYDKLPFSAKDLPHNAAEWQTNPWIAWYDMRANGTDPNKFSDYLEEQVKRMNDSMIQTPGRQAAIAVPQQQKEGPSLTVYGPWGMGGKFEAPQSNATSRSQHMEVEKQFEATTPDDQKEALKGLQRVKAEYDRQFIESYQDAVTHNFRMPPQATLYYRSITDKEGKLRDGGRFPDQGNEFRDKQTGQLINPYRSASPSAPSASPTPSVAGATTATATTTQPSPTPEFDKIEDAANFVKSHKSGTYFKVKGRTFQVD